MIRELVFRYRTDSDHPDLLEDQMIEALTGIIGCSGNHDTDRCEADWSAHAGPVEAL